MRLRLAPRDGGDDPRRTHHREPAAGRSRAEGRPGRRSAHQRRAREGALHGAAPAHPHVPQARGRDRHARRSRGPADGVRQAAQHRQRQVDQRGAPRLQHRGAAAVHELGRAREPADASALRGGARVRGARDGQDDGRAEAGAARRRDARRRRGEVREGRGRRRRGRGRQSLVPRRAEGGPQPRGAAAVRGAQPGGVAAHPHALRHARDAVGHEARRHARTRGAGSQRGDGVRRTEGRRAREGPASAGRAGPAAQARAGRRAASRAGTGTAAGRRRAAGRRPAAARQAWRRPLRQGRPAQRRGDRRQGGGARSARTSRARISKRRNRCPTRTRSASGRTARARGAAAAPTAGRAAEARAEHGNSGRAWTSTRSSPRATRMRRRS